MFALIIHLRPVPSGNQAYSSGVGLILSVVSVVVSGIGRGWSCRAGIGQPKEWIRSRRARFERGCIRDTVRLQQLLIGDIRSSIRAGNFLPDHTRPSHKNWSAFVGGWSAVWCECSFSPENKSISGSHETVEKKKTTCEKKSCARDSRKEKTAYKIKKSCERDYRKEKTIYEIKKSCARDNRKKNDLRNKKVVRTR